MYYNGHSKINSSTAAFYEDQLKLIWSEVKRPPTYEYHVVHGDWCTCCTQILQIGNDKVKLNPKREKRYI